MNAFELRENGVDRKLTLHDKYCYIMYCLPCNVIIRRDISESNTSVIQSFDDSSFSSFQLFIILCRKLESSYVKTLKKKEQSKL